MQSATQAFEKLKSLTGTWRGSSPYGKDIRLTYEVTGNDSALIERYRHYWHGKLMDEEMVTLYHLSGEDLVLTHYCTLGNQPKMRAMLDVADDVIFEYVGASNLTHPDALKMTGVAFHFIDEDRITQTWKWDGEKKYVRPENRSDDFDDIPDSGEGVDTFTLTRVRE
ncbi:hypothetical protein [Puniceibacterium sediminis]|uniref:DUF1579 domain-containing protein n=1 Tax=Puniceibacterium sediminis TaxID=1608407 RepID=A0A238Z457_9RHOB|nr:hypothetical protein [Puniceibacterium sediminis]SNR77673.1 hypothetical protein SAMN06265370_1237 [Puniceibacterium sediminis]